MVSFIGRLMIPLSIFCDRTVVPDKVELREPSSGGFMPVSKEIRLCAVRCMPLLNLRWV